jgi:hypothetical protein
MRSVRAIQASGLLAVILVIAIPSLAQSPKDGPLTNADLVRLVKAGIPENTILRVMQVSETSFTTNVNALIELKHHHVPDRVIDALLDSRGGGAGNQTEPAADLISTAGPLTAGTHRLPNFDAAVRFNGKSNAKIAVRQNHIKVENAGHPLFTLSWKENGSN